MPKPARSLSRRFNPAAERERLRTSSSWKHRAWFALHTRKVLTAAWLTEFTRSIRCVGCRRHWLEAIAANPPPLNATPARTFAWTVRIHNEINKLLNKPILSLREAKRRWIGQSLARW